MCRRERIIKRCLSEYRSVDFGIRISTEYTQRILDLEEPRAGRPDPFTPGAFQEGSRWPVGACVLGLIMGEGRCESAAAHRGAGRG